MRARVTRASAGHYAWRLTFRRTLPRPFIAHIRADDYGSTRTDYLLYVKSRLIIRGI